MAGYRLDSPRHVGKTLAMTLKLRPISAIPWPWLALAMGLLCIIVMFGPALSFTCTGGRHHGDFIYFYKAAAAMRQGNADIYTASKDPKGTDAYIYPTLMACRFQPLSYLPMVNAAVLWLLVSAELIFFSLLLSVREIYERFGVPVQKTMLFVVALLAAILVEDKLKGDFNLGQTDCLLLVSYALALYWMDRQPILAGIAIGFAANIKYMPLIFLPYFILRGRYRSAAATVISFAAFMVLPALSTGLDANMQQIRAAFGGLSHMSNADAASSAPIAPTTAAAMQAANISGIAWDRSISLTSALVRLGDKFGMGVRASMVGIVIVLAVLTGLIAWQYGRQGFSLFRSFASDHTPAYRGMVAVEWAILIILSLLLSPQTTTRHMVLLLPAMAVVSFLILVPRPGVPRLALAMAAALEMLGLIFPPPNTAALEHWRVIGGISWCSLILILALVYTGTRFARQSSKNMDGQ